MTSSTTKASLCAVCDKIAGNFTCCGCGQSFCTNHVTEHRQTLAKQMDEIVLEHDQLKENITNGADKLCSHHLMKEIDDWENKSIEIIRREAAESRETLKNLFDRFKNKITDELEPITQDLEKFRKEDTFVETNLTAWTTKLQKLKSDLEITPNIVLSNNFYNRIDIWKPSIVGKSEVIFQDPVGSITIEDGGKVIKHGMMPIYASARCNGDYSSGCHQFSFQVEYGTNSPDIFFGIISKTTPMQRNSSTVPTAYGWTGNKNTVRNGVKDKNYSKNLSIAALSGMVELLLDCDRGRIFVQIRRKEILVYKDELEVDPEICPFPWQLNFCLGYWGDRIRL